MKQQKPKQEILFEAPAGMKVTIVDQPENITDWDCRWTCWIENGALLCGYKCEG